MIGGIGIWEMLIVLVIVLVIFGANKLPEIGGGMGKAGVARPDPVCGGVQHPGILVLGASGHIAGVVNPPASGKYQYWTDGKPEGEFEDWVARAKENPGSWWPHWQHWIERQDNRRVAARKVGASTPVLCDAPGEYVRVRV